MSTGVEFEEPQFEFKPANSEAETASRNQSSPKMIALLIKTGLVRSENAAAIILVAISSLFFAGSILFYMFNPFL